MVLTGRAAVLALVGAGVVIGLGLVFAGIAVDGWMRERAQRQTW